MVCYDRYLHSALVDIQQVGQTLQDELIIATTGPHAEEIRTGLSNILNHIQADTQWLGEVLKEMKKNAKSQVPLQVEKYFDDLESRTVKTIRTVKAETLQQMVTMTEEAQKSFAKTAKSRLAMAMKFWAGIRSFVDASQFGIEEFFEKVEYFYNEFGKMISQLFGILVNLRTDSESNMLEVGSEAVFFEHFAVGNGEAGELGNKGCLAYLGNVFDGIKNGSMDVGAAITRVANAIPFGSKFARLLNLNQV